MFGFLARFFLLFRKDVLMVMPEANRKRNREEDHVHRQKTNQHSFHANALTKFATSTTTPRNTKTKIHFSTVSRRFSCCSAVSRLSRSHSKTCWGFSPSRLLSSGPLSESAPPPMPCANTSSPCTS